jgi:hypothetical protein
MTKKVGKVGKDVCFELLKRGLRYQRWPVKIAGKQVFTGQARNWPESADQNFLRILADEGISLATEIIVFDQGEEDGEKKYCITRKASYLF